MPLGSVVQGMQPMVPGKGLAESPGQPWTVPVGLSSWCFGKSQCTLHRAILLHCQGKRKANSSGFCAKKSEYTGILSPRLRSWKLPSTCSHTLRCPQSDEKCIKILLYFPVVPLSSVQRAPLPAEGCLFWAPLENSTQNVSFSHKSSLPSLQPWQTQHFTALWNVLFHVSPHSANVSACLRAEPCHPHCCCLQLLWAVTSPPAHHPLHHRRARRDWEDVFKCQEGMAAPEGLQPMETLPRCAPAAMAGSFISSQCQITLVFILFPSLCTTAISVQAAVTFVCSLGVLLEGKLYLCGSWERCLSTSSRKKRAESTQRQS